MEVAIKFSLIAVAIVIGALVGAFTIGQMVLVTNYGIPLAVRLKNKGIFANYGPLLRYIFSFFVILFLFCVCLFIIGWFFPYLIPAFLLGVGFVSFQLSSERAKKSEGNLENFIESNAQYFTRDLKELDEYEFIDYFNIDDVESMEGNQVFARVVGEALSNSIFFGILVVVFILLGKLWWWLGVIAAGIYLVIVALSILQTLLTIVMGFIGWPMFVYFKIKGEGPVSFKEQFWLSAGSFPRLVEVAVDALFVWILYNNFFPPQQ